MNKKVVALVISVIFVILLIVAGTYAYWVWNSNVNKNVVFNTLSGLEDYIVYDEGNSSFVGNFQPIDTFCQSTSTTISFYKESELIGTGVSATINMDVNSIGTNISLSSDVYWVLTKGDSTVTCDKGLNTATIMNYGTFNGVSAGDTLTLTSNLEVKTEEQKFTVWIWIDSSGSDLSSLSGETIDTNVWTQVDLLNSLPEEPDLDEGMIPVTISDDGKVTTIRSTNSNWYDYSNKEWANAVLVTDSSRSNYLNTSGVTVTEDDILAYYVWIPRYKYRVWTTGLSASGGQQAIDIVFEDKDSSMSAGTTVGSYRTHPAFWWDDDSDGVVDAGETVAGIWVGKFETSANTDSTCYTSNSAANCVPANVNPRIVPSVKSLRYQTVSNQFATSQKFSASGNEYGLNNASTNAHMMKNSEWGALAYLSHSVYGINEEVYINNSSGYFTGRSGGGVGSSSLSEVTYGNYTWLGQSVGTDNSIGDYASDRTLGTNASTTGNVTGVYDMSGGGYDNTMANYNDTIGSSGFSAMPESKYYNKYTITADSSCTLATCGGHALSEVNSWYGDFSTFVTSDKPWFTNGGRYGNGASCGAFSYYYFNGGSNVHRSWRSVLVIGFGE